MKTITSSDNQQLKNIRALADKKERDRTGLYLAEGWNWLSAVKGDDIEQIVVVDEQIKDERLGFWLDKTLAVPAKIMDKLSQTETPPGVMVVLRRRRPIWRNYDEVLLLENLQDPGNLGTIIRTAAAADCSAIILSKGCVDPYSPKVVRATMGAILTIDIFTDVDLNTEIERLKLLKFRIYGAALTGDKSLFDCKLSTKTAWVIGNESRGLSPEAEKLCTKLVRIPMTGKAESLNASVAAGLCLYEYYRQIG